MRGECGSYELGVKVMMCVMRDSVYKAQQQVPSSPENGEFTNPWIFVKGHKTQFLLHMSLAIAERSQ